MSDGSSIGWCNATWTIAVGCTRVDHRCDNCYAIPFVHRGLHESHRGVTKIRPKDAARPGVDWNGTVRTLPERLADPLRWRKPRRIFVGSMTDLFHPQIPFEYVAAVFGVMQATPWHTYLLLTKRPDRQFDFFEWTATRSNGDPVMEPDYKCHVRAWETVRRPFERTGWPLPNVHLGVSVSDQPTADDAIPKHLRSPAALHWVSYEPALGSLSLARWMSQTSSCCDASMQGGNWCCACDRYATPRPRIGWVVAGGESGPRARDYDVKWGIDVADECRASGVPFFFKQLGSRPAGDGGGGAITHGDRGRWFEHRGRTYEFSSRNGDVPAEWPVQLRVQQFPTEVRR